MTRLRALADAMRLLADATIVPEQLLARIVQTCAEVMEGACNFFEEEPTSR